MSESDSCEMEKANTGMFSETDNARSEVAELQKQLNASDETRASRNGKLEAMRKIITATTQGKDLSVVFAQVMNNMQTTILELKKLVYLYMINYASEDPDVVVMCVNSFVKDATDPNPLIRALALRTMGCVRVNRISEYLADPLLICLDDEDPYVKKTASICVAKLFSLNPELVVDRGFVEKLYKHMNDSNPMVITNALAALSEMDSRSAASNSKPLLQISPTLMTKWLQSMDDFAEWGKIIVLDCISDSFRKGAQVSQQQALGMSERLTPLLNHSNSAVVMSSLNLLLNIFNFIGEVDQTAILKKIVSPLTTLLTSDTSVQYLALRSLQLIIHGVPRLKELLESDIKIFFIHYYDPIFIKMEKLDLMMKLTNEDNYSRVMSELVEYCTEADVEFVRKAVSGERSDFE